MKLKDFSLILVISIIALTLSLGCVSAANADKTSDYSSIFEKVGTTSKLANLMSSYHPAEKLQYANAVVTTKTMNTNLDTAGKKVKTTKTTDSVNEANEESGVVYTKPDPTPRHDGPDVVIVPVYKRLSTSSNLVANEEPGVVYTKPSPTPRHDGPDVVVVPVYNRLSTFNNLDTSKSVSTSDYSKIGVYKLIAPNIDDSFKLVDCLSYSSLPFSFN